MSPGNAEGAPEEAPPEHTHVRHDVTASVSDTAGIPEQLRRRRDASRRLVPLECGHRDPLDCRATPVRHRESAIAAYQYLHDLGLMSDVVKDALRENWNAA